ncbi:hypothetical protein SAMN05446037_100611 [Anaerovirgula multivorans]|uniref:Uncharacterized protein n=1 Tax=Anaerovirgula multivorans TaxID=312168 RepID=A0A239CK27_9FIRM|nr:hypothetical protein [Anaerovirgula multivorans]SNS20470.1 hypothetical protein SAMN05446037_100611 [Anaerovirgula multivorans]
MFRLPKEADTWFDFDIYYFCLIAGLSKGLKEAMPGSEVRDLILRFPQEYRAQSKIITALFLKKELDKMGVSLEDRKTVHETIKKYIDSESPSNLSEEGQKEINKYANGGIIVLKEYFEDKPYSIEMFIINFFKMIDTLNKES